MTSGRRSAFLLSAACVACVASFAVTARAEPTAEDLATARQLFKEGRALREQGDIPKALEKLRAAHALGQTPITGIELARTYVLAGRLVEAHEVSLGVARLPVASDETEKSDQARAASAKLAAELEPRLAKLIVSVKGLAPGSVPNVSVDGERIPPAAVDEPRSANPGAHVIVLTLPGGAEVRAQAEMKEGESRAVVLDATSAPAPQPSPPVAVPAVNVAPAPAEEPAQPPPHHHSNFVVVTGATVAGLGVLFGAAFGVATLNAKGSLQVDCPGGGCGPQHYNELSSAQTEGNISTASFIVAGVGAVAVILDLALRPKSDVAADASPSSPHAWLAPDLGPGWVGAHGSF
jgi:hypothetical protein